MKRPEKKSESLEIRLPHSQKHAFMEACRARGVTASDALRSFIEDDLAAQARQKQPRTWTMTIRNNPFKTAAGMAGAALAVATFGTGASIADDEVFSRFDRNGDGLVTYAEFMEQVRPERAEVVREVIVGEEDGDRVIVESDDKRIEKRIIRRRGGDGMAPPPPMPPAPRDGADEIFRGLDRDGSGTLTRAEFGGEGTITRRSDDVVEINGESSRMLALEVMTYDVTKAGSVSISINALSTTVATDAPDGVVEQAYRDLEEELRTLRQQPLPDVPEAPRP